MQVVVNHFLDIVIAVVSLVVIISSFYKPTFRYIRWLVGAFAGFLVAALVKGVRLFNFIEKDIATIVSKLKGEAIVHKICEFLGKGELAKEKFDTVYNLFILVIIGLIVFIIINLIMGIAHGLKVRRANRRGDYVYNSPVGSFFLATICCVLGIICVTIIFAALPFETDFVSQNFILRNTYKVLEYIFNLIHSVIPQIQPFGHYIDKISGIRLGVN